MSSSANSAPPGHADVDAGDYLVLAPGFVVESLDDRQVTICLQGVGTRLRLPKALHAALMRFMRPSLLAAVAEPLGSAAWRALDQLRARGFLVPPGTPPVARLLTDPPVRLFDGPAAKLVASEADIVVVGFPWDFGDPAAAGARRGPLALRETSLQLLYSVDPITGRAAGWFDADERRPILQGVAIADAGDVLVRHGEPARHVFERGREAWRILTSGGATGIVLGGDSSAAFVPISACAGPGEVDVIRVCTGGGKTAQGDALPTANTLASHALALSGVRHYYDLVPAGRPEQRPWPGAGRYRQVTPQGGDASWLDEADVPVHLGIDMAALASATSTGFDYRTVRAIVTSVARNRRVISIDVCGLNPAHPCWGALAMTALHLLVAAVSAARGSS
ncbi:arginase family protein [Luteibacter aegosomaticola]|uniref:arginase family protein n=1 Tax=Luteibacter aegosomaticola TaxID=2911538 RepID=UPI001FF78C48|nr:arginase family protein [Luteibacter aegosomaticola]UPG89731.1 arginase family protein [Luteibacter aegosomaticola]